MTAISTRRPRASKPSVLVGVTIGCCAALTVSSLLQPSFVPGGSARSRTVSISRADGARGDIPKWQSGLDTACFDLEASPLDRINGLSQYFREAGTTGMAKKMIMAANTLMNKGAGGAQETLDLLLPKGLHLRADVDASLDFIEKTGPQRLLTEFGGFWGDLERTGVKPPRQITQFAESISERILPVGAEQASLGASNVFRTLPRAQTEHIDYLVIYKHKDFEVRAYQPFEEAKVPIQGRQTSTADVFASSFKGERTSVGGAFMSMVEYVKKQQGAMKVLMPIMTHYNKHEKTPTSMSLPLEVSDAAQIVQDSRITFGTAYMQLVAVRTFLGVVSDREMREQSEILENALIADGVYDVEKHGSYSLMQYNAPLTAPWRRRNEIGITVKMPRQI